MREVKRRITYKLYPSKRKQFEMERVRELHRQLCNAALEERIDAWKKARVSISYPDQCRSLTQIRRDDPEYRALNCHSGQETLSRLDRTFKAFFRRVKASQKPGFPRFRSRDGFISWGYKKAGDGFTFTPGSDWRHGKLRLSEVGTMRARGQPRQPGRIVCANIHNRAGRWYVSLVIACEPKRAAGTAACGLDWGVADFATLATAIEPGGAHETIANPRLLAKVTKALRRAQRKLSRCRRGSKRRLKAKTRVARLHKRVRNTRADFQHKTSAGLIARFGLIATETLTVKNLTRSARGSVENPGRNVRAKSGLNRNILDTAPAAFLEKLRYKAEEAGAEFIEIAARNARASQACPACGAVKKKTLSQRMHRCKDCGHSEPRDAAAARNLLRIALGREPAEAGDMSIVGCQPAKPPLQPLPA